MTEYLLPGKLDVESEFQGGLTGACGPNAIGSAGRWSDQSAPLPNTVSMNSALQAVVRSPNGVSTLGELETVMRNLHYTIATANAGESALAFATRMLISGVGAVVMFYEAAQALTDLITGSGMDAGGLQGHFNMLCGYNSGGASPHFAGRVVPQGFLVADGDNNVQNPVINGHRVHRGLNNQLVYYTVATMLSAHATEAFAVLPRRGIAMGVPAGWKDDGTTLVAPNGMPVKQGFRDFALAYPGGWEAANFPLAAERGVASVEPGNPAVGAGTRQDFRWRSLGWTPTRNVYVIWVGQDILALSGELIVANTQIAALDGQLSTLNGQVATLEAQVAALQKADIPGALADLRDALTKLGA